MPIICYSDGVSTDVNGRLGVVPFNITLGIFNTETRFKPEAWTTLFYHLDNKSKMLPTQKIQNMHHIIEKGLEEVNNNKKLWWTKSEPLLWWKQTQCHHDIFFLFHHW